MLCTLRARIVTQVYCQMEALRYCLPPSVWGILGDLRDINTAN